MLVIEFEEFYATAEERLERCDTTRFVEGTFASAYRYQIKPAGMGHPIPQHKNAQVKKILEANDGSADVQAVNEVAWVQKCFLGVPWHPYRDDTWSE